MPQPDVTAARNMMLNFNSFKVAALREGWDMPDNDKLNIGHFASSLAAVSSRVQTEPPGLIVFHRDFGRDAQIIKAALARIRGEDDESK